MDAMDLLVAVGRGGAVRLPPTAEREFFALAVDHRVTALARRAIGCGDLECPDLSSLEVALAAHELRSSARLELLEAAAFRVVRRFIDRGCNVMVAKGWWASHVLHDRPWDRVFSDIDLVIPPDWAMRKVEIDDELGPSRAHGRSVRSPADSLRWWTYDLPGITVDVHRNPFTMEPAAAPEAGRIWREHAVAGDHRWGGALAPSLELGLAQLAVNYGKDRLRWLYQLDDIRRLMVNPDLNWPEFWKLVDLGGVRRPVTAVLAAVARTLEIDPPPGLGRSSPLMIPWVGEGRILSGRIAAEPPLPSAAYRTLAGAGLRPGLGAVLSVLLPNSEALAGHLEVKSLEAGSGYVRGLGALYRYCVKRLSGTAPPPLGDTPAVPVWALTESSMRPPTPTMQSGDRT